VHEPEVLFADEPTGNLDGVTGAAIVELLFSLRAKAGATLFLVTHEEALAARCDRILRMKDGLIVAEERHGT
jgi:putative ABC transport system ATP-binding protein